MRYIHRAVACLLSLLLLLPGCIHNSAGADTAARVLPSVVVVRVDGRLAGSGFQLREGVVTNAHVLGGGGEISVERRDGRAYPAVVLRYDGTSDLALLRADGMELPDLALRPDPVRAGEAVLAVGHPHGLRYSVSAGIVSAHTAGGQLQTDVRLNPGSSGGPLVDRRGRVVGVNTAVLRHDGHRTGIGFAVTADTLADFLGRSPTP